MTPPVIFLVGATATGKTGLSIELSRRFPVEIVNADSLQVFRHLDIGTAKPSKKIQSEIKHHLIDVLDPDASLTSKEYRDLAESAFKDIHARNKIPLVVGGAGFYIKAITNPGTELPAGTREIKGSKEAHEELTQKDPAAAKKIHPNDHYRLSRALFLLDHGILPSQAFQTQPSTSPYSFLWLGLSCERTLLRKQIEERVQSMFQAGIVEETRHVLELFPKSRSRLEKTIGYTECLDAIDGKISAQEAQTLTTTHTCQYAKRQETWFRKNPSIIWSERPEALGRFSISIDQTLPISDI